MFNFLQGRVAGRGSTCKRLALAATAVLITASPLASTATAAASTNAGVTLYFSPYDNNVTATPFKLISPTALRAGVKTIYRSQWAEGCPSSGNQAYSAAEVAAEGRNITAISGWSLGRGGVAYFLQHADVTELMSLNYVLLIDPIGVDEYSCSDTNAEATVTRWLQTNPAAHLVVLGGNVTQQNGAAELRRAYGSNVRGSNPQVQLCNYNMGHKSIFLHSQAFMAHRITTDGGCPTIDKHAPASPGPLLAGG